MSQSSIGWRRQPAIATTAHRASGRGTTRATSAPSCSTPTATTSRPSATIDEAAERERVAGLLARRRRARAARAARRVRAVLGSDRDAARQRRSRARPRRGARPYPRARAGRARGSSARRGSRAPDPGVVSGNAVTDSFTVTARDRAARAGILHTAHGEVRTPAFLPVGTKATVKAVDPDELRALGAEIVLANTYHLHFRPGEELIAELGGLHAFMGWDGPILTDSGGFQVFSLRDTLLAVDDDGVTFRSVYDGSATRFTPELAARIQLNLGSDIAMCLDQVPHAGVSRHELAAAVTRTTTWARVQREAPLAPGQLRFGIAQGAADPDLRRRS